MKGAASTSFIKGRHYFQASPIINNWNLRITVIGDDDQKGHKHIFKQEKKGKLNFNREDTSETHKSFVQSQENPLFFERQSSWKQTSSSAGYEQSIFLIQVLECCLDIEVRDQIAFELNYPRPKLFNVLTDFVALQRWLWAILFSNLSCGMLVGYRRLGQDCLWIELSTS